MKRGSISSKSVIIGIIIAAYLVIVTNFAVYFYFLNFSLSISGSASNVGNVSLFVEGGDTIPPDITLVSPSNVSYTSHRTGIDYTVSDTNLQSCWYSLNAGSTNTSVTCGSNVSSITSSEGSNTWTVYANDSSGNRNSSAVTFTVSIPVSGGTGSSGGSSGGGGGGGGGGASLPSAVKIFEVTPEELNVFLVSGKQDEKEIKVINTGSVSLTVDIEVSGINEMVSLNTNRVVLKPNEEQKVILTIKAPEYGIHAGRIIFKSGNLRRDVFVLVNVRSDEALFDVSITIPDSYKIIPPNKDLKAFISLQPVGAPKGVDVTVNYVIKDFDGNTVLTGSETFFVLDSKGFVKDFSTLELPPGDYIVGVEVIYSGGFATSSEHFSIRPRILINYWIVSAIGFAILAVIVIVYSALRLRRYKKENKYSAERKK